VAREQMAAAGPAINQFIQSLRSELASEGVPPGMDLGRYMQLVVLSAAQGQKMMFAAPQEYSNVYKPPPGAKKNPAGATAVAALILGGLAVYALGGDHIVERSWERS
jgi:hypothetical protein